MKRGLLEGGWQRGERHQFREASRVHRFSARFAYNELKKPSLHTAWDHRYSRQMYLPQLGAPLPAEGPAHRAGLVGKHRHSRAADKQRQSS